MLLSLFYVFLFYLPFTFMSLILNKAVFFQLDHLYQFSTIIFDFRNKIYNLDFSTWDFKNGLGYDYFANFYYIPLDITLLPFFLFPFLSFSQLMWLSFILKILLGTLCFSYLLKLYKISHKNILFMSILYGTADLFFAQNVFPSYTGLIIYIPLILIAIEYIFQKNNYLIFSLVIFQIFLFNYYWAWNLSLFMAFALLGRTIYTYFTKQNLLEDKPYKESLWIITKSIFFYLLGLGLAAFFFMPTFLGLMKNEPRMELSQKSIFVIFLDIFKTIKHKYDINVYLKLLFKMLVPNLYMYSGYFYDTKISYWLMTNHMIIYSSILSAFSLFSLLLYPRHLIKQKLNSTEQKIYYTLKITTIISTIMLIFPIFAHLFSLNSGPYQRYLVFYGFLLIINITFIIEYKLFNKKLFLSFLVISCGYLIYSLVYNSKFVSDYKLKFGKEPNIFISTDESVTYTMLVMYLLFILLIILYKKFNHQLVLLFEKIVGIALIFSICVSPHFIRGVKHVDIYGKEVNKLMKDIELEDYYTLTDFLFYNDEHSEDTMQDMAYLFDFPVYSNFNIFHSLVNPHFTIYETGHTRYLRAKDMPYYLYYYMDPSLTIISNSQTNIIKNGMYDPESDLIVTKKIDKLNSYINIYKRSPQFSIGNGFTTYYDIKASHNFDYLWIDSLYVNDEKIINLLEENNFKHTKTTLYETRKQVYGIAFPLRKFPGYEEGFHEYYFTNLTRDQHEVIMLSRNSVNAFTEDLEGNIERCYRTFCFVPEKGLKSIIVDKEMSFYGVNKDYIEEKTKEILKYSTYDVKINKNKITSKVDNDKPIIMTYKVGYAKGWNVYVDNKKVDTFASYNGQLSFIINETGTHNIKMVYETPYLKQGLKISLISMVIFAGFTVLHFYKRGRKCIDI